MALIVKCAWCGKEMGEKESVEAMNGQVSHGICEDCFWKALDEIEDEMEEGEVEEREDDQAVDSEGDAVRTMGAAFDPWRDSGLGFGEGFA